MKKKLNMLEVDLFFKNLFLVNIVIEKFVYRVKSHHTSLRAEDSSWVPIKPRGVRVHLGVAAQHFRFLRVLLFRLIFHLYRLVLIFLGHHWLHSSGYRHAAGSVGPRIPGSRYTHHFRIVDFIDSSLRGHRYIFMRHQDVGQIQSDDRKWPNKKTSGRDRRNPIIT